VKVFVQSVCDRCDGNGVVQSLIWKDFFNHFGSKVVETHIARKWFYDKGYDPDFEPEEINCSTCDGKGYINEWIDIKELQEALKKK